jgi:hypothetical protein
MILDSVKYSKGGSAANTIFLLFRVVFGILMAPYVFLSNLAVLVLQWSSLSSRKHIKLIKIVTAAVIAAFLVVLIAMAIFLTTSVHPLVMNELDYVKPTFTKVTSSLPTGICGDRIGGYSIMELASFNMLAHQVPDHTHVSQTMAEYLSVDHKFQQYLYFGGVQYGLFVRDSENQTVLAIQGVTGQRQLGILFENILSYWYSVAMGALIPFFGLFNDIFLAHVLSIVSTLVTGVFLGLGAETPSYVLGASSICTNSMYIRS